MKMEPQAANSTENGCIFIITILLTGKQNGNMINMLTRKQNNDFLEENLSV